MVPIAEATSIAFVSPLFVAVLAGPLLGERVGLSRWAWRWSRAFGGVPGDRLADGRRHCARRRAAHPAEQRVCGRSARCSIAGCGPTLR